MIDESGGGNMTEQVKIASETVAQQQIISRILEMEKVLAWNVGIPL